MSYFIQDQGKQEFLRRPTIVGRQKNLVDIVENSHLWMETNYFGFLG